MNALQALGTGLLVLSFVLAVIDGAAQDKGTYPEDPGRTGLRMFSREHPWVIAGALTGIAGTILSVVGA